MKNYKYLSEKIENLNRIIIVESMNSLIFDVQQEFLYFLLLL